MQAEMDHARAHTHTIMQTTVHSYSCKRQRDCSIIQPPLCILSIRLQQGNRMPCRPELLHIRGSEIDGGYQEGHTDATGEVARSLSDIARLSRCLVGERLKVAAAGPEMAGKASEPFSATW